MTRRLATWLPLCILLVGNGLPDSRALPKEAPDSLAQSAQPAPPPQPDQPPPPPEQPPAPTEPQPPPPPPPSKPPKPQRKARRDSRKEPAPPVEDVVPNGPSEESGRTLSGRVLTAEGARATQDGVREIRSRHFPEAVNAFRKAAGSDSRHPVVWNNLGTAYLAIGKPAQAEAAFRKAIHLDPNYAQAHYNLGTIRDAQLDYDGAIQSYARAFELDPGLASPAKNPPVVNNTHLAAIYVTLYRRQAGALGGAATPLDEEGEPAAPPVAPAPEPH